MSSSQAMYGLSGLRWHGGFTTNVFAISVVLLCLATQAVSAATRIWSAPGLGGDRRWSVPANWGGVAPVNGDSLVFPEREDTTFPGASTNNISNLQINEITFSGLDNAVPDIFGNTITLSGGITEFVSFWGAACFVPINLSASQIFESASDGRLELTNVNLSTHTLTLLASDSSSQIWMRGRISGSGGLVVRGLGTVSFMMPLTNTYTGLTRILDGELQLRGGTLADPIPTVFGDIIVGDGTNVADLGIFHDHQIEGDVTVNRNGELYLDAVDILPSLTLNDGNVLLQSDSVLSLGGPLTVGGASNSVVDGLGEISLGSAASRIFDVTNNVALRVDVPISGTGLSFSRPGIIKNGGGTLLLLSNNTFNGAVSINDGRVIAAEPRALGTASSEFLGNPVGRTFVNDGGELLLSAVRITNEVLTLSTTVGGLSSTGSCAWLGSIIVTTNAPVNVSNSTLTVEGNISGSGGLVKTGTGTLTLTGDTPNTFTGRTRHNAGLLLLDKPADITAISGALTVGDAAGGANADIVRVQQAGQINDSAAVNITSSGQLDLNAAETIGSLSGAGQIRLDGGELTFGGDGLTTNYAGVILGTFGLTKIGSGTQTFSGNNTYTGQTRILAGTLRVDGSQPQSPVNVIGANLEGGGVVGHVTSNGRIAPGGSALDILTTSNMTFQAGGSLEIRLGGDTPGVDQDQLLVRGSVALASAALNLSLAPNYLPNSGDTFVILSNDGADAIGGTFSGLANNSVLTLSPGRRFRIQYNGGDGNDVVLTFTNETVVLRPLSLAAGNGNARFDPNECGLITGSVSNQTGQTLSDVTVEFIPRSAGLTISEPVAQLPTLPPNAVTVLPAPVIVSASSNVVCGDLLFMDARLSSGGSFISSTSLTFLVGPGGPGACVDGGGICTYCPDVVLNGTLGSGDVLQTSSLATSTATDCGNEKSCPGTSGTGTRRVDALIFQNGPRSACIRVTLSNRCDNANTELFATAYQGAFNPANICANHFANIGEPVSDTKSGAFSFEVRANELFVLTVNETKAGSACGDYTLTVTGGDCRPRLQIVDIPGANVRLTWPNSGAGWVPEFSGTLSSWSNLSGSPTNVAGRFQLDTSGSQPARFFRLREP